MRHSDDINDSRRAHCHAMDLATYKQHAHHLLDQLDRGQLDAVVRLLEVMADPSRAPLPTRLSTTSLSPKKKSRRSMKHASGSNTISQSLMNRCWLNSASPRKRLRVTGLRCEANRVDRSGRADIRSLDNSPRCGFCPPCIDIEIRRVRHRSEACRRTL